MDRLNYRHLFYFWVVAREGTIVAACKKLRVAQPTISAQLRSLETELGQKLFARSGRTLRLTETGRLVYRYTEEIFSLGRELQDMVKGRPVGSPIRFNVGVADVLPKLLGYRLLAPAVAQPNEYRLVCFEGKTPELLARLAVHELDVVLADSQIGPAVRIRAYSHEIGECGVSIFGTKALRDQYRRGFPGSLDGAPFLLPTVNTAVRQSLDGWFETTNIRTRVVGEFEDRALMKAFGQAGVGLFPAPSIIEKEVARQYRVRVIGRLPEVREHFFAISMERKVKHPGVLALVTAARGRLQGDVPVADG